MPTKFTNRVKGNLNEILVKILLEDVGYQVVPLGIEQVASEVKALTREEYKSLGLRPQLRTLPDFLVIDRGNGCHWLLEVKYRKKWDYKTMKDMKKRLTDQAKCWGPFYLLVVLGKAGYNRKAYHHSQHAKVFCLDYAEDQQLTYCATGDGWQTYPDDVWKDWKDYGKSLTETFDKLKTEEKTVEGTVDACIKAIKQFPVIFDD